jgi:pimeloyl-ACP methyl ester carboxylesterase
VEAGGMEMGGCAEEVRPEFGVLFVGGIGKQRAGSSVRVFAAALYGWLFWWNSETCPPLEPSPALHDAVLSPALGGDDGPAHVTLQVPLQLGSETRMGHWLLAESSWGEASSLPRFVDLAHWIWKVSTCLLVLQFVIPMHRHWRQPKTPLYLRLAVVLGYLILMGVAAILSVPLSLALFAVALTVLLPIPRIDLAVRWLVVKISAVLGDSYVLAHCPVEFAAMRSQVARDLSWLQGRCDKVAVVGHSQGAAIAHQVLKEHGRSPGNLRAFITFGQGISKMLLLQKMDWDPDVRWKAWLSRWLVAVGLAMAGLPAVGWVVIRLVNTKFFSAPAAVAIPMIVAGFLLIFWGVHHAMKAARDGCDEDLPLCIDGTDFFWADFYASADPVSNGPLISGTAGNEYKSGTCHGSVVRPRPCSEVYNRSSLLSDHNSYLRNQDQFLPELLNALATAAYCDGCNDSASWPLVAERVLDRARRRRRWLVRWLVTVRVFMPGVAVLAWLFGPVGIFQGPMNQLTHVAGSPHMGHDLVRLVAAALITVAAYLVFAIIPRRVIEYWNTQRFFHAAERYKSATSEPAVDLTSDKLSSSLA